MNRSVLPTLIGAFSSLLAIWALHTVLIVNDCTNHAGTFNYGTAKCLLDDGQIYQSTIESVALALYFVIGFGVSYVVSTFIRKVFKIPR